MTILEAFNFLKNSIYTVVEKLKVEVWVSTEPVIYKNRFDGEHKILTEGDKWGSLFDSGWFHFTGRIPETGDGVIPVLLIDINGELLLVDENGNPLRGLTNKSSTFDRALGEPVKHVFRLPLEAKADDLFEYWGDAGCNDLFGEIKENGTLKQADIAICREDIRSLFYDYEFLINWMENISKDAPLYRSLKIVLQESSAGLSDLTETTITKTNKILKDFFRQFNPTDDFTITAIGHSHLDLAWLWPVRETRRKIGRTLSTVIELMDRYPDYVYGISQPQSLQWVKEDFPVLFSKVKEKIKEGRIEVLGAMWVEPDTNLPSGESLVRQIIYGKKFWKEEFSLEGELYLEKHQGTYTTEGLSKWYNRKMEINLRKMELFSALAMVYSGQNYPADKLDKIWREILLYQFHDILPGSSIKRVYDESWERYSVMLTETERHIEKAEKDLIITAGFIPEETNTKNYNEFSIIAFNSLSWDVSKWISINNSWARITIPSIGYTVQTIKEDHPDDFGLKWDSSSMENKLIAIKFTNDGSLMSIFDKENQRELLASEQRGNSLLIYSDSGDAWDFPSEYRKEKTEQFTLIESTIKRNGPELINHQVYKYEESVLKQDVVLTSKDRRIDFRTRISWATPAKMVRTSFPVDIPTGKAMCEIQFGAIERPVQSDTSWDLAKDEVAAHSWIDISNNNYGVALFNDSKYGHRVKDRILDISLLRSVSYPGPVKGFTDIGEHEFTYSLFPHKGSYGDGGVVQAAHELNSPPGIYQIKKNCK